MKIKKLVCRILEISIIITTIIITIIAINYATKLRGYIAYGGEYLIPILGLLLVLNIETKYEENKRKKGKKKNGKG